MFVAQAPSLEHFTTFCPCTSQSEHEQFKCLNVEKWPIPHICHCVNEMTNKVWSGPEKVCDRFSKMQSRQTLLRQVVIWEVFSSHPHLINGFVTDSICQTQPKWLQMLRRKGFLPVMLCLKSLGGNRWRFFSSSICSYFLMFFDLKNIKRWLL